ncbi:MAG: RNA polymerase subunit sigma, partial [Planctomycetales bacterium]|nr:RNA polymerase subunit sigma [Planctomycetales bacterium]
DVHQALEALEEHDPRSAEVVKLHYFGGYSIAEIADLQSESRSTINRCWVYARAWLKTTIEAQSRQA